MGIYGKPGIKSWAVEERPREKLLIRGISALTDGELIAILISSGSSNETAVELSRRILETVHFNLHELGKLNSDELQRFRGIGEAKAVTLLAAMELGRRRNQSEALENGQVKGSKDAANFLRPEIGDLAHEEFWVLFLNRQNKVVDKQRLSQGGMTGTVIDVRLVLKLALEKHATSLIFGHNHPSGNVNPSNEDIKITKKIKDAALLMDINTLDHVIIADSKYYSFADEGIL